MDTLVKVTLVACMLLLLTENATAQERYKLSDTVSGGLSVRERYESKDDFRFDDADPKNDDDYLLSQIRLNLQWDPIEEVSVFIEAQDSRANGEESFSDKTTPNIFADEFDLHQAYVDLKNPYCPLSSTLRLGRQKLKFGSERLVGPLEWVNTARVFDAAKITLGDVKVRTLEVFASRAVGVDPNGFNNWGATGARYTDSDFHGAYYTDRALVSGGSVEGYYLLRHEDVVDDSVSTLGSRLSVPFGTLTADGEFAAQFGDFGGKTHRAYAAHAGVTWLVAKDTASSLNAQYNFASGDSDSSDSTHETFDNLYPTNHGFYGYMDFFSLQNIHNIELSASHNIVEDLTARLAWNGFWLAEADSDAWYGAGFAPVRPAAGTDVSSFVGNEIDLSVKYPFFEKRLWAEIGYSHFFTGSYVSDTGASEDADFFYTQVKLAV